MGTLRAGIVDGDDDALGTRCDLDLLAAPGALDGHVTVLRSVL